MRVKLRAILGLVLATTLFTSAAPATLSMHYCGGELMDASFTERFNPCCEIEEPESPSMTATSCEFDQYTFNSYEDGYAQQELTISPVFILTPQFFELPIIGYYPTSLSLLKYRGPPPMSGATRCIQYEHFRL